MFNIKWGVIAAAAALLLSLLVGSLNHVALSSLVARAGIFALVFFALGVGIRAVADRFLLDASAAEFGEDGENALYPAESPGSRVNITLDDGGALPEAYNHTDHSDEVGNIADLLNGTVNRTAAVPSANAMDQTPQNGYTDEGAAGLAVPGPDKGAAQDTADKFQPVPAYKGPVFTTSVSGRGDLGGLADLDAMVGAFSNSEDAASSAETPAPSRSSGGKKPQGFESDFNPKELAEGIRTILVKEKQG